MSQHWYDREKGRGVENFKAAQQRQQSNDIEIKPPATPQPQLTPHGPLRTFTDQRVREQQAAEIARRKEQICQKFEQDRAMTRSKSR